MATNRPYPQAKLAIERLLGKRHLVLATVTGAARLAARLPQRRADRTAEKRLRRRSHSRRPPSAGELRFRRPARPDLGSQAHPHLRGRWTSATRAYPTAAAARNHYLSEQPASSTSSG